MSYILDALKKSEQERGHGSAPGVQTLHSSSLSYHTASTPLWPYLLLGAVLVNLAALVFFMMDRETDGTPALQRVAVTQAADETGTAQQPAARPAALVPQVEPADDTVYKPVSMPDRQRPPPVVAAPTPPIKTAQSGASVVEMDELPFDLLQQIPAMEFSAHVYSSNPVQRSLVINGRFMEEGDYLSGDLYLSEITRDGAIFDFQGQRFQKRIVSAWN